MSDAITLIYHPVIPMKAFNARIQEVCEDSVVTSIEAAVVDGSLVVTLLTNVVTATEEDVDDEKAESDDGKCSFKVGDFIPDGEALVAKCLLLSAHDPAAAATTEKRLLDGIYTTADGLIEEHRIVIGRGLVVAPHPEDVAKAEDIQRKVYVEKEVAYAVVIFLAEALEPDGEDERTVEQNLRKPRPRSATAILDQAT